MVDAAADHPPAQFATMRLFYAKAMRHEVAFLLENFRQVSQEQETYPTAIARLKEVGKEKGLAADFADHLEGPGTANFFRYTDLRTSIESGLIDQAKERIDKANNSPHLFNHRWAEAYLAAARVAYQQARLPILKQMLALAREEMAQDTAASKSHVVLEYAIRTAEYRQRRLQGFDPTDAQVIAEFKKAWSALENYKPMVSAGVDATWMEGRQATRFWMEELARLSEGYEPALQTIGNDWQAWWDQTLDKQRQVVSPEDLLLKWQYLTAFYILGPNYFDQLTYRWVKFRNLPKNPKELEWAQTSLARLPETVNWVVEKEIGDGFPPYSVASAGLIPELWSRCKLVGARMPGLSKEARLALLEESVVAARAATQPSSYADHMIAVGLELKKLGQVEQAIECWQETVSLTDDVPLAKPAFEALFLLAREYFELKDWAQASRYAELATQKLETVSPLIGVRSTEAQKWTEELASITELAAKAHIAAGAPEKALGAITRSQQMQAAALQVEGQPGFKPAADALRNQQQQVASATEQVKKLESQPASPLRDELLAQTRALLADSKAEYLVKSRELRQKHPTLYSLALKFDPLDLPSLQSELPADVAVLQYFPTETTLYTFLVTRESFRLRSVDIADSELDKRVSDFLRTIRRNVPVDSKVATMARQLHDILIAPSGEDLQGKNSLVLIPTGRLHGLPFSCLIDDQGRFLVQKWQLLQLAKSSDLQRLSNQATGPIENLVAFANATGDLPAAAREGEKIAAMFPGSRLFKTTEATRANFFAFGGGADILHLATHGEWNLEDSLKNYLSLAGSEKVAQEEIFQLALDNTSIVILSACNTAMGEGGEGGYVASLAEAFWLAGSRSVLASQWSVNDDSTALLMETFYSRLRAGDNKAEALRAAQLLVGGEQRFKHPYYWAGFVLFGELR
jgi:CHAT domain-containing protein